MEKQRKNGRKGEALPEETPFCRGPKKLRELQPSGPRGATVARLTQIRRLRVRITSGSGLLLLGLLVSMN